MRYSAGRGGRSGKGSRSFLLRRAVVCLGILSLCAVAMCVVFVSLRPASGSADPASSSLRHDAIREKLAILNRGTPFLPTGRLVYPYSVVPGGVQTPAELQRVSADDRVVSSHFAGFDYRRAQVMPLPAAKEVYLSYRVGDRVYWTSKKIRLRAGEKVITDGKITARTRCANRVSETKQAAVSPNEPPAERFEHPVGQDELAQLHFPSSFDSALLGRPQMPDPLPVSPTESLIPPSGGSYLPGLAPPPLPGTTCETDAQEKAEQKLGISDNEKGETHCPPPSVGPPIHPPAAVPEPGTILLVSSGLAGIYLRYRRKTSVQ